jgi:hypothetical protein
MNEKTKLGEAKYFYNRMLSELENSDSFKYDLSAFLSAARSVLQYALKESKTKTGGFQWFKEYMSKSPVLSFFKDKRNANIHAEPIKPTRHINVTITETIGISASVEVVLRDKNGNIKYQSPPPLPEESKPKPKIPPEITIQYKFDDWSGNEDVITLSRMYLNELEPIVEDGIKKGFISG